MIQTIKDLVGHEFDESKVATLRQKLDQLNALQIEVSALAEEINFVSPLGGDYGIALSVTFNQTTLGQSDASYNVEFGQISLEHDAVTAYTEVNPSTIPSDTFLSFFEVKRELEEVMKNNTITPVVL